MATLLERANELMAKRANVLDQARKILEKDEITAEDRVNHRKALDDAQQMRDDAEALKRQHDADAVEFERRTKPDDPKDSRGEKRAWEYETESRSNQAGVQVKRALRIDPDDPRYKFTTPEYQRAFRSWLQATQSQEIASRALALTPDSSGGYMVPPQKFVADLIKDLDDMVTIRPLATIQQVTGNQSLGAPYLSADPADASWTTEIATVSEDSTMAFGTRELVPHPLRKLEKVSKTLIRNSALGVDALVRQRLGYKFGITEEKAFLTGSGSNQPLGVFTASSSGISTSRDVSTGNTSTEIRFDGLIKAKYTLKAGYRMRARWIFHRDGIAQIAQLKDGNGQYLWRESVRVGEPDRVLNLPVLESEYAPNTFTTTQYVGILGDFSYYWIAEDLNFIIQTLVELYAATNQNGYIGDQAIDGMPVLENAFVRVKLA